MEKKNSVSSISLITAVITLILMFIVISVLLISTEKQLYDCRFEVKHLQTKLHRLQELNNYIPAMEQTLPPLVLAQLKATTEMIRQKKYREYEKHEQPILDN